MQQTHWSHPQIMDAPAMQQTHWNQPHVMELEFEYKLPIMNKTAAMPPIPYHTSMAMAYIPYQTQIQPIYEPEEALQAGTLFKELDKPWLAEKKRCRR
jgi:hypothetical protein